MIGVFCPKGKRMHFMDSFFQEKITFQPLKNKGKLTGITAYGGEDYIKRGKKVALEKEIPFYNVHNGISDQLIYSKTFNNIDYSLIVDNGGSIYSQLENLLNNFEVDESLLIKGQEALNYITTQNSTTSNETIILVDEHIDDNDNINKEIAFKKMIERVKGTYPLKSIKIISSFEGEGYLKKLCNEHDFEFVSNISNAKKLIVSAKKVFVVESLQGFIALLHHREVHCFGIPFYSGFGLTIDEEKISRDKRRTLVELFTIFFYLYEKQINPLTGMPSNLNEIIKIVESRKDLNLEIKQSKVYCFGIQPWKRGFVRPFVEDSFTEICFPKNVKEIERDFDHDSELLVWGHKEPTDVKELANKWNKSIMRIEDGFIRSVGLGTNVTLPWSLALDRRGIYYNPQETNELENLLNFHLFTEGMLKDARTIKKKIVEHQLTKYNSEPIEQLKLPSDGKKVILVPGQVEDDASIRYGCKDIKTNTELLNCVREKNPQAYIIYKPHPDIVSRNRKGEVTSDFITDACDHIEVEASIISCINYADEVHTMTSLSGFDALLRDKTVYTYGLPFYAGWGLTNDRHKLTRRQRRLSLDELVAGTLFVYPKYYDWENNIRVSCDTVVEKLIIKRNLYFKKGKEIKIPKRLKKVGFLLKEIIQNR